MKRSTILILSAVLIAAVMSGCVQELSEIGTPGGAPQPSITPPTATPDAAPPAPTSEVAPPSTPAPPMIANWKYVSYRNLSISDAPVLNQTARITYSIIPDRDVEVLSVGITIPAGFIFVDADKAAHQVGHNTQMVFRNASLWNPINLSKKNTCLFDEVTLRIGFEPPDKSYYCAIWYTTNLSKGEMYQFTATIKSVKTGNWTIHTYDEDIYISVSEDSAYIRDTPFPYIPMFISRSQFEKELAEQNITPSRPSDYRPPEYNITPIELETPDLIWWSPHYWNGTAWVEGEKPVMNNQS